MDNSLVSVIIPTKNSSKTLEACLKSIKNQNYKDIELIVVDNFSTDGTQEIAKRYADKVFEHGPERSAQRNFGAKNCTGEFLLFIDSDMELSKEVVEECVKKANTSGTAVIIPEESFGVGFWAQCKKLERSFYVGVDWMEAARFFEKGVFKKVSGYNEQMISGEDWDLSQRVEMIAKIDRIDALIHHNEGELNLFKTLKKKYYYAGQFKNYSSQKNLNLLKQTNVFTRYGLFFSQPVKLFKNPSFGVGMLFMKTCEFATGAIGYITRERGSALNAEYKSVLADNYLPTVSFIIPTLDASKYLDLCLVSIFKQEYPKEKIEILIIDGGSTDSTLEIASKYEVKVLENKRKIAEYGKAIGIKESKGEYFVLMDSDNEIIEKKWTRRMVRPVIEHPELFGVESPLSHDLSLSSLNRYFARMRIADPLAKSLASKPTAIDKFDDYSILKFSKKAVLITGANGFLWNKKMVMKFTEWCDKFEEANFSTFIHDKTSANYAIPEDVSIRHYYCSSLNDYLVKRKKIALKIKGRIQNKEYTWVNKNNLFEIFFYVIYLGTLIGPLIESIYKNLRYMTFDYTWHPLVSFLTIWVYGWNFIKKI